MHGKKSKIHIETTNPLFFGLPPVIEGARYHSLCAEKVSLPKSLNIIAQTDAGEVMGVKHNEYSIFGVQFHPESILTTSGEKIIENFLNIT
jgi:anthranilate synthase component II